MSENRPFSRTDLQNVLGIMESVPVRNLASAREIMALQARLVTFCEAHLPKPEADKPAAGGKRDKRGAKSATEVDPVS